uniref:HAT C-terminal dimerisation domain-containing protein n=1 Tax=Cyprinodon variegatus TaxID=28743 RepID=A0A3Q2GD76_CYPVA
MKHLWTAHASTKLVAQEYTGSRGASVNKGPADKVGPSPSNQNKKLDFSASAPQKISQTEPYGLIGRYVVENMLPISTVELDSFRELIGKIPRNAGNGLPCRKTFTKYIFTEYAKINAELKKEFEQLEYLATTADIWTAHNKSYLGVTADWMHPANLQRKKAALACRRFKGHHTHETTVTCNGSNFVKAFKKYQSEEDNVINLPPHYMCASHTLNLVSCSDIERWILSRPEKEVYRSATAKCTALWNKASRSTVAAETVEDVVAKKLILSCSNRWNYFYDALARICETPILVLNTISSKFGLKAITAKEHQLLKEYCIAMKPLTTLMTKILELKSGLQIHVDLPEANVEFPVCSLDSSVQKTAAPLQNPAACCYSDPALSD